MKWPNFFSEKKKEKFLQSVDDRGWTRIFDWRPGAYQQHTPYDTEESVLSHPVVFACHTLIQGDIGKLKPIVQKKNRGIWEEATHPIANLLKTPNNYQNHIQFKQHWLNSKLNHGNTYVLKTRSATNINEIVSLQILDPLKVTPLVADNGEVFYRLDDDRLAQVTEQNTVPATEIIHDRHNCLYHPLVGMSAIFAAGANSTMGLKIINNSKDFFANGSNPSGVLTAPGSISESTAKRLKEYFEGQFSGDKSGRIAVAGDGLKYDPMRMSSTDSQLLEQLNWSDERICACFHVPGYMVGVGDAPSYNNIEALTLQYYAQCLQILIESMEASLDAGLGVPDGYRVQMDLDALFRMDQSTMMKTLSDGAKSGFIAPDEGRKRLNLPPVPGGENPYLQQQNYSLEALARRDQQEMAVNDQGSSDEEVSDEDLIDIETELSFLTPVYKSRS